MSGIGFPRTRTNVLMLYITVNLPLILFIGYFMAANTMPTRFDRI